jgi:hypothetical protein
MKAVTGYTKDPSEWKAIDVSFNTEWVEMLSLEWPACALERLLFTLEHMVKIVSGLKRSNKSKQSDQTRSLRLLCEICHGAVRPLSIDSPPLPFRPPMDKIFKGFISFFSLSVFLS